MKKFSGAGAPARQAVRTGWEACVTGSIFHNRTLAGSRKRSGGLEPNGKKIKEWPFVPI
jgi:hypothetical protein